MEPTQAIYGEAVAGQSAKHLALRKRIMALAQDLSTNTFDIAEAFLEAQESRCYLEWGFESLGDYASLELGIKHRKCQYLARIVRIMRACGVPRIVYEPVGVTKLREITTLDPETTFFNTETKEHEPMVEHIVRLVAEAPENSTVEVEEEVARLKGLTGENSMVTRSYKIVKSAWDNTIAPALEQMRKLLGSKGRDETGRAVEYPDGTCFEYICRDWLNDPRNYMEETDESQVQIEAPSEESNVANENQSTESPTPNTSIGQNARALDSLPCEESVQDVLPRPIQPFVISTED